MRAVFVVLENPRRKEPKPTEAGGDATSSAGAARRAKRETFFSLLILELKPAVSPVPVRLRSVFLRGSPSERETARSILLQLFYICILTNFPRLPSIPYYLAESLTPKEATTVIGVVAGLLGLVAVLLVAAVVGVIYKHRNKPDVTGAVTLPLVRDNVPGPG